MKSGNIIDYKYRSIWSHLRMCWSPEITKDRDYFTITFAIHELSSRYLKVINFIQFEKFWAPGTFEILLSFLKNRTFHNLIETLFPLNILHFGEKKSLKFWLFSKWNLSLNFFLFQQWSSFDVLSTCNLFRMYIF